MQLESCKIRVETQVGQCGDQIKSEMECVMLLGCAIRAMQKSVLEITGKCFTYNSLFVGGVTRCYF